MSNSNNQQNIAILNQALFDAAPFGSHKEINNLIGQGADINYHDDYSGPRNPDNSLSYTLSGNKRQK